MVMAMQSPLNRKGFNMAEQTLEIKKDSSENLSDAQFDNIAEQAIRELEAEKDGKTIEDHSEEVVVDDKAKEQEEAKAKEEADKKAAEDKQKLDQEAIDKANKEKQEAEAKTKAEEEKKPSEDEDKVIRDYALKHDLTVEEAKEDFAKNKALLQRFKSPEEMARAMRLIQSERDKLASEREKVAKQPPVTRENLREQLDSHIEQNREKILANYKKQFPVKYDSLPEEAIIEEVKDKILSGFEQHVANQQLEIKAQAANKRDEILADLKESEPDFYPDIKAIIVKTSDNHLLSEGFDVKDIVRWAKGGRYNDDVKTAEERGYRRGKEEAVVIGEVAQTASKSTTPAKTTDGVGKLSDEQKERALQMFDNLYESEEEKYKAYADTFSEQLKKNPKYIG
jgi:hypothetical protein